MKTVIEVWHTDKDGWKSNYFATKSVDYDEKGKHLGHDWWQIDKGMTCIYTQENVDVLRKVLDEIEKELSEDNN